MMASDGRLVAVLCLATDDNSEGDGRRSMFPTWALPLYAAKRSEWFWCQCIKVVVDSCVYASTECMWFGNGLDERPFHLTYLVFLPQQVNVHVAQVSLMP